MHRLRQMGTPVRAALAVAALYGVLLQAFLSGLAPIPATALDHAAICAPAGPSGPGGDGRRHDGAACCLAACLGVSTLLGPVAAGPSLGIRYARPVAFADRRDAAPAVPRTGRLFDPRGPPAA